MVSPFNFVRFLCTITFYFVCFITGSVFCFSNAAESIDQKLLQDLTTDMRHIEGIGFLRQRIIVLINGVQQPQGYNKSATLYDDYYVYDLPENALTIDPNGTASKLLISGATLLSTKWPKLYDKLKSTLNGTKYESVIMFHDALNSYALFSYSFIYPADKRKNMTNTAFAYNIETGELIDWSHIGQGAFPGAIYSSDESLTFYQSSGPYYSKSIFYGASGVVPKEVNNDTRPLQIKQKGPRVHVCRVKQDDPDGLVVRIDDASCKANIDWAMKEGSFGAFTVGSRLFSMRSQVVMTFEQKVGEKVYLARIPYEQFLQVGLPDNNTTVQLSTTTEVSEHQYLTLKIVIGATAGLFVLGIIIYCLFLKTNSHKLDDPLPSQTKRRVGSSKVYKVESRGSLIRAYHDSKGRLPFKCKHSAGRFDKPNDSKEMRKTSSETVKKSKVAAKSSLKAVAVRKVQSSSLVSHQTAGNASKL